MTSRENAVRSLVDLYQTISSQNVLVAYQGAVSNDMIMYLASVIESKSSLSPKMKRVFGVFLEMAQNIMRYSEERGRADMEAQPTGVGKIMVTEHPETFVISAANLVDNGKAQEMTAFIDQLNALSKEDQKSLFIERRKMSAPQGSLGAGLGLIEMARKSDMPLEYVILPSHNPSKTLLLLIATLKKN